MCKNYIDFNGYCKNQLSISLDLFKSGLYLRRWEKGDRIISAGRKKHILVSDLFINNKLSMIYHRQ